MAEGFFPEDTFLSDVHIGTFEVPSVKGTVLSRFAFSTPPASSQAAMVTYPLEDKGQVEHDEDGDLLLNRRNQHCLLVLEHAMSTILRDVGLQVWRGALLMADYILHSGARFQGCNVLELGAGVGLVSIMAALHAKHIFCTDTGDKVLDLCRRNIERNLSELDVTGNVFVRELEWTKPYQSSSGMYSWSAEDMKILQNTAFILAADIVYEDSLTDAFFSCLVKLHTQFIGPPIILIALEKRINFTVEDLAPASPAYEYFRSCMEKDYPSEGGKLQFAVQQLSTDFPQYFHYERVKELELWEIRANIQAYTTH